MCNTVHSVVQLYDYACRRNLAATFRSHIINSRDADNIANHTPVRVLGSCSFMYMRHGDVYILGVTKTNANVMMAFQFMTNVRLMLTPALPLTALFDSVLHN